MEQLKTLNKMLTDNPTLLSFVTVPQSVQDDLSAETLKTAIIRRCGDVAPYYQKPADFSLFGALWFNTHDFLFTHALELWKVTYNPIENYDRIEEETVSGTRETSGSNTDRNSGRDTTQISETKDITETHGGADAKATSTSKSGSDTHSGTDTLTDNVTRETEIAGFDSASYSDANRETETGTHATAHGESISRSETEDGTEDITYGHTISTDADNTNIETVDYGRTLTTSQEGTEESETSRDSHIHGNIGVTTAQQMIEAELNLANKFWIYDYIANAFETDNFITVYNSYWEGEQWR